MDEILQLFKLNIGISSCAKDELYETRIKAVIEEFDRQGITINEYAADDQMLVADYAAWEHRKLDTGEDMPKNIERRILRRKTRARCGNA